MRSGRSGGRGTRHETGYSLVEVVVALVVLQVGLLGAAGLVVTAARAVARAARTDRALVLAEAVADSLQRFGWGGVGERVEEGLLVRWSPSDGWVLVEVRGPEGDLVLRIPIPVEGS